MGNLRRNIKNFIPNREKHFDDVVEMINQHNDSQYAELWQKITAIQEQLSILQGSNTNFELIAKDVIEALLEINKNFDLQTKSILDNSETKYNSILEQISYSRYMMMESKVEIGMEFEREYYKEFPVEEDEEHPNFTNNYLTLINNLDEQSIETIVSGLQRLKVLRQFANLPVGNMYSIKEQRQLQYLNENFSVNTYMLAKDKFIYKKYLLPINHFEASVFYYRYNLGLLTTKDKMKNLDVIDAGAFIGDSALIFSEETSGNIHCFEPNPESYNLMLRTIELNQNDQIIPINMALGDSSGEVELHCNSSSSTMYKNSAFEYSDVVMAKVTTIDEYVAKNKVKVGLIKADLEGAEQQMLKGAYKTIKEHKPILLISIYHNADDFFYIKPLVESWGLGYTFKICRPTIGYIMTETILIAEIKE